MRALLRNGDVFVVYIALMEAKEDFYAYKSGVYHSAFTDDVSSSERQRKKRLHSVRILG